MSDVFDLVADVHRAATNSPRPAPDQVRALSDQRRSRRRRAAIVTIASGACLGFAATQLLPANRDSSAPVGAQPTGAAAPMTSGRTVVLRQATVTHPLASGNGGGQIIAAAGYGHGDLWLALPSRLSNSDGSPPIPGDLVRVDPQTLAVTGTWPTIDWPISVVVSDNYVWVSGVRTPVDPSTNDIDEVQQFDLQGTLRHTYPLTMMGAPVAAQGDAAWTTGVPAPSIRRLHDGSIDPPTHLPGMTVSIPQVAVCAGDVYVATQDEQHRGAFVERISPGEPMAETFVPGSFDLASPACGPSQGALLFTYTWTSAHTIETTRSTARHIFVSGTQVGPAVTVEPASYVVDTSTGADNSDGGWLVQTANEAVAPSTYWFLSSDLRNQTAALTLPDHAQAVAAHGRTLWTVTDGRVDPNTWTITAIAAE
jgi:hypothetical protein